MNLFDLSAKITLDTADYEKGIKSAGGKVSAFASKLGESLKTAAKVGAAGIAIASGALVALTKNAVKAYAEFEQLEGGVKKIFGDEAAKVVMQNAEQAFKTAGMSVNEYMDTVTGVSASLVQSVGGDTVKAAHLADVAIRDMSDNANTFGTDINSIRAAYQGFAKGNFTMLDNLKLGYGGTKTEMERLIKDAEKLDSSFVAQKKRNGELTMSYADIVKAIHIVQENMNIAGTTEKEAAATIQGALFMTKSAWQNLITAFGKGEGVNDAMKALTGSAKILVKNILPVVKRVLSGVADAVKEIAPTIIEYLPDLVSEILPSLLSAAATLFGAVIKAIPGILKSLYTVFESFLDSFESWLETKAPKLAAAFRAVRETVKNVFSGISTWWEKNMGPAKEAVEKATTRIKKAWGNVVKALEPVIKKVGEIKDKIAEYFKNSDTATIGTNALSGAIETVTGWVETALEKFAAFIGWLDSGSDSAEAFKAVVLGVVAGFTAYAAIMGVVKTVTAAVQAAQLLLNVAMTANPIGIIIAAITALVTAFVYLWNKSDSFRQFWINAWEAIKSAVTKAKDGIVSAWTKLKSNVSNFVTSISTAWENAKTAVVDAVEGIKIGLEEKWSSIKKTAETWWGNIKKAIVSPIESAKTSISTAIDNIKRLFKGEIKLNIKLPHITWGTKTVTILGKAIEVPDLNIEWYKKAYNTPYMFTEPTVVGGLGFGDGQGGEMVYGHDNLMRDISAAARDDERMDIIIDLLRDIVENGVNANFNRNQMYKTMANMNRSRSYATGYNGFSGV